MREPLNQRLLNSRNADKGGQLTVAFSDAIQLRNMVENRVYTTKAGNVVVKKKVTISI